MEKGNHMKFYSNEVLQTVDVINNTVAVDVSTTAVAS